VFEGGVRSVSWLNGGVIPDAARGTKREELFHAVDIFPTIAALAGVDQTQLPSDLSGEDVWGTIVGASRYVTKRTELPLQIANNRDLNPFGIPVPSMHMYEANYTALIQWPWKLILGASYIPYGQVEEVSRAGWWTIGDYAYTPPPSTEAAANGVLLFNLAEDEREEHDAAAENPDVVSKMSARIKDWWLSSKSGYVRPQLNMPRPLANPKNHNWTWSPFWHLDNEQVLV